MATKKSITLPAPGKINLFLHVLGRRNDGYHELQTAFQFIELCDWVTIQMRNDAEIKHIAKFYSVTTTDEITIQAAKLFLKTAGIKQGVTITVAKHLPIGGGVGGGSSDAATVLMGLNFLYNNALSIKELAVIGGKLGADVPIFIHAQAAMATGIGNQLVTTDFEEKPMVLVKPSCSVSTKTLFNHPALTRNTTAVVFNRYSWQEIQQQSRNDFEMVVFKEFPQLFQAFCWLKQFGNPRLTGTGACLFLVCDDVLTAENICRSASNDLYCWSTFLRNKSPLIDYL